MANDKLLLDNAVRAAMQPQLQQAPPQQQQERAIPLAPTDLVNFIALGVLSPKQVFDMVFARKAPEDFEGIEAGYLKNKRDAELEALQRGPATATSGG